MSNEEIEERIDYYINVHIPWEREHMPDNVDRSWGVVWGLMWVLGKAGQ